MKATSMIASLLASWILKGSSLVLLIILISVKVVLARIVDSGLCAPAPGYA
jgi:hypothetical protein